MRFGEILIRGNFKTHGVDDSQGSAVLARRSLRHHQARSGRAQLSTHLIFNSARVLAPVQPGRNVAPVLVVVQERYIEAYGALTFAVGAASDRLPDYAYVQATYLWSNFLGYGSQLELRGDFAWLAALLGNPITMGASLRYTDTRAFGPGWRYDLAGVGAPGSDGALRRHLHLRRLDGPDAQHHAGVARVLARRRVPVADQRRLLAAQRLQRHRRRCPTTRSPSKPSSASPGIAASTPTARSIRWRRPRAGCCKARPATRRRGVNTTPFLVFTGQAQGCCRSTCAAPSSRSSATCATTTACRPTRRPCRSSSASTPAATRKMRGYDTDALKSEIIRTTCRRCRATPASASCPKAATSASSTPSSFVFPIAKSFLGLPLQWAGAVFWDMGLVINRWDLRQAERREAFDRHQPACAW